MNSDRFKYLIEEYILYKASNEIMSKYYDKKIYKNFNNFNAMYQCIVAFLMGVRKPEEFNTL